jgi:bifunctional DNA-binding transcriptional regulator/antitoxin component of YhaV-PrlF toxin-antitoxin module
MPESLARPIGTIRVGEKGEITVPAAYRKKHKLSKGSEIFVLQLGEALVMVPADPTLNRLCQRIQDILTGQGVSTKQAVKNLEKVRRRHFQDLYGKE